MKWRLNISSRQIISDTGEIYARIDPYDGWWFVADPDEATTWEHYRHAVEAARSCPDIGPKVIAIEPVHG